MSSNTDAAEAQASREATDWLILLQEDPADPRVQADFAAWQAARPENATAWARTQQTAGLIGQGMAALAASPLGTQVANPSKLPNSGSVPTQVANVWRPPHRRRRRVLGAMVAVAACVALVVPSLLLRLEADYTTGTAETRRLVLADGSTLVLAPESAVAVAFNATQRHITLLRGEAYFTVQHDPARPFRVSSLGIDTTDIGTRFDIRRGADGVAVAVEEGRVRVDFATASPPVREALSAGDTLDVSWSGHFARGQQAPLSIAAWRQKQLIALDQPLRQVVDRVRPYFAGQVIVAGEGLGARPVTGVYNLADPLEALRGIARAQGARLRQITPWIVVLSEG